MKEIIYCETRKERDYVLKRLEEMSYKWINGYNLTEWKGVYDAPMTIAIEDNGCITQGNYKYVCTAKNWLEENSKYKKGDLFQIKPNIDDLHDEYPFINNNMKKFRGRIVTLQRTTHEGWLKFREVDFAWLEKWSNPIKEIKRPACAGEFIKVVNADNDDSNEYKNGDILEIVKSDRCGRSYYEDKSGKFLNLREYVVLEGYEDCDQVKKFAKKIKVGSVVKIVDAGKLYKNNSSWVLKNIYDKELIVKYAYGYSFMLEEGIRVVKDKTFIVKHIEGGKAYIQNNSYCDKRCHLIDLAGLEVVE